MMMHFLIENGQNRSNSRQLSEMLSSSRKRKLSGKLLLNGMYFTEWRERCGEDMTAIKTQMNIYQNFLQTNTKSGKLFKKELIF
jgi:hypothetical protein